MASLECVQFGLKQFDMVLVFNDSTRTPLHINSIPSAQLDDVNNWLEYVLSFYVDSPRDRYLFSSVELSGRPS